MKLALILCTSLLAVGCYHFSFEQNGARPEAPAKPEVTYKIRVPTYVNGFVGTGRVDTSRYCEEPVRTELRVTATDVLLSVATLLIYTPHTLYVTCERGAPAGERIAAIRRP
jgi:hypothetical protein